MDLLLTSPFASNHLCTSVELQEKDKPSQCWSITAGTLNDPLLRDKPKCTNNDVGGWTRCEPARMAFPGCVIFLPPTAAAARFLLAA